MTVFSPKTPSYEPVISSSLSWAANSWGVPFYSKITDLRLNGNPIEEASSQIHVAANEFFARNLQNIGIISNGMVSIQPMDASGTPIATFTSSGLPPEADLLAYALQQTYMASETRAVKEPTGTASPPSTAP